MNSNEAAAALDGVEQTEKKLAERARWPFHRHAMFGLSEGLLIAAIAQPAAIGGGMAAAAFALLVVCIMEDRRRHGMFISGWQQGGTRPLMVALVLFLVVAVVASALLHDGDSAQPLGYVVGAVTFAVCTAASLLWEKIYRAELRRGGHQ